MRWWYHRLTLRHGNCRYMWRSYKTLNLQTARSLHSQVMIMPEPKHYIFIFCDPFSHSTFGVFLSLTGNGTWGWYSVTVCAQPLRDIATITLVWYGYIVYLPSTGLILACASMLVSPVCRSISSAKVPDGQQGKTTEEHHRNRNVDILTKLSWLAAPKVVKRQFLVEPNDETYVKIMTFPFHWWPLSDWLLTKSWYSKVWKHWTSIANTIQSTSFTHRSNTSSDRCLNNVVLNVI